MRFDVLIIGGGTAGISAGLELQKRGLRTAVIAAGRSTNEVDWSEYESTGGEVFAGDKAISGIMEDGRLLRVKSANFGSIPLEADQFVIATGKFLGKGLVADMNHIYEPVFGLDVIYDPDRSGWFENDFSSTQPFLSFGVSTDSMYRPSVGGRTIENLFACGELLHGISSTCDNGMEAIVQSALNMVQNIMTIRNARA